MFFRTPRGAQVKVGGGEGVRRSGPTCRPDVQARRSVPRPSPISRKLCVNAPLLLRLL